MLSKLSLKNIKKSIKDYTIYFFTLILGISIFYVFNALDTQTAMMDVSESTQELIKLMMICIIYIRIFNNICFKISDEKKKKIIWNLFNTWNE